MKKMLRNLAIVVCLLLLAGSTATFAQLTVTANQAAAVLAQKLAGSGITIMNANLVCAGVANGSFTAQSSNLGIDSGIVLTTGHAVAVAGPEPGITSYNNNTNGDPALQTLSGASATRDACILQFDLVPKGDTIRFDYVFGSEEYINSICGPYNDAFAFFISGPGISGTQNMALVPGTNIPVTVNSINNGVPGSNGTLSNCTSMGAGSPFTSFYNNNMGGTTVTYRGLTSVLTAAHAVTPCDTFHLKLTIADAGNGLYDSGVFIKAGSLQSSTFTVTAQGPVSNNGTAALYKGCLPGSFTFSRSAAKPTPQVLTYQVTGTAINGFDYISLPATVTIPANAVSVALPVTGIITPPAGLKALTVQLLAPFSCNGIPEIIDSARIDILDAPGLSVLTPDTVLCQGDYITLTTNGSTGLTYRWSPAAGLSSASLANPLATPAESTTYTLKAFVANAGCDTLTGAVSIEVRPRPFFVDAGNNIDICNHTPILIDPAITPDNSAFIYTWSLPDGTTSNIKELSIPDPTEAQSGYYYFNVNSGVCGALTDSVFINVVSVPGAPQVTSPLRLCLNATVKELPVYGKDLKWYRDAAGTDPLEGKPLINTATESTQNYYVSQSFGNCESGLIPFSVIVERCCDDFIFVPSVFSPNNDGNNDYFDIHVENGSRLNQVQIFNRWGQMVFQGSGNTSWNGLHNNQPADIGTYYYNITFTCKDGTLIHKKGEVLVVR